MKIKNEKVLMTIAPAIVRLCLKAIRFSKDGYTKDEAKELGEDLLVLALSVLQLIQEEA
jgi:hypothetical protein